MKEAEALVTKLIGKHPEKLGHVDADVVACVTYESNQDSKAERLKLNLAKVMPPISSFSTKKCVIWFHEGAWERTTPSRRADLLMRALRRIQTDHE